MVLGLTPQHPLQDRSWTKASLVASAHHRLVAAVQLGVRFFEEHDPRLVRVSASRARRGATAAIFTARDVIVNHYPMWLAFVKELDSVDLFLSFWLGGGKSCVIVITRARVSIEFKKRSTSSYLNTDRHARMRVRACAHTGAHIRTYVRTHARARTRTCTRTRARAQVCTRTRDPGEERASPYPYAGRVVSARINHGFNRSLSRRHTSQALHKPAVS